MIGHFARIWFPMAAAMIGGFMVGDLPRNFATIATVAIFGVAIAAWLAWHMASRSTRLGEGSSLEGPPSAP